MSSSIVILTILPTMPPSVRVRSKGEREVFVHECKDLLNDCEVWLEASHNIQASLLESSNPEPPCTKIHPWYLNLGLKFPLFAIFKEILVSCKVILYNVTPPHSVSSYALNYTMNGTELTLGLRNFVRFAPCGRIQWRITSSNIDPVCMRVYIIYFPCHDKDCYKDLLAVYDN